MSSFDWSQFTLEQLRAHKTACFRQGGGSRPDVFLIETQGHRAVLKDQNQTDKWFAFFIAPILNWRECKALIQLHNTSCVPQLLHRPNARAFLMEYRAGEQITKVQHEKLNWNDFFASLEKAILQLHQQGIAHNDLRNPTNILLDKNGNIVLVDLVAAFSKGNRWNYFNRWAFNKFCQVDLSAITKLKQRFAPELLNENDIQSQEIAGKSGMRLRALGQCIRKLSRAVFIKKK